MSATIVHYHHYLFSTQYQKYQGTVAKLLSERNRERELLSEKARDRDRNLLSESVCVCV